MVATHRSLNRGTKNFQVQGGPAAVGRCGEVQEDVAAARRELRLLVLRLVECHQLLEGVRRGLRLPEGEALDALYEVLSKGEESHPAAELAGALECLAAELSEVIRGLGRLAASEDGKNAR